MMYWNQVKKDITKVKQALEPKHMMYWNHQSVDTSDGAGNLNQNIWCIEIDLVVKW